MGGGATRAPWLAGLLLILVGAAPAPSKAPALSLEPRHLKTLSGREVGPANMGGRISDFAVDEKEPSVFFVATGTGGVFKTTNGGTTWSAVFEKQAVASIGAVALWQKNPDVVWVGTGEANSRNSSSWGNGVYRSADGGSTWSRVGLEATRHIARVVLDPADSNVAYVAALGRLWGENPERGVYKTRDAGKTWQQILKADSRTGAVDLAIDPSDPRVLYAALYTRIRTPWSYQSGSTSGGIFKTMDGGRTWRKLTAGLPAQTGRIGLDVSRKHPRVVMAVIESDEGGHLQEFEDRSRSGGVFRSEDGGEHWKRQSAYAPRPFYFSQIRLQPDDDQRVYLLGYDVWISDDAGRTFRAGGAKNLHPDCHAMWIDPARPDHLLLGTDGGAFQSFDRAVNWDFLNNLAIGEFYTVVADARRPYWIYGGLQDNQSWGGPSRTRFEPETFGDEPRHDGITSDHWFCLGGGDGFYVAVDPTDPDLVYYESQGGYVNRLHLRTGRERGLRPSNKEGEPVFRFNWNAPFVLSPHDPSVLWLGGNHVFRLYEHGEKWALASPDLTTRDPARMVTGGSAAESYCTITTLQESPRTPGLLWAGTDDGKLWLTRDGGKTWTDLTTQIRGVPRGTYVSRVEASHHDSGTAYVAFDGHRTDDLRPYLMVTRDYGRSWASITGDLPGDAPVKVVREGLSNPHLLFAGTEFGLFASLDGGGHWTKFGELPTVAVDDLFIHPREQDLVVGTHGRSVYVIDDIAPLEHWTPAALRDSSTLFPPRPAWGFQTRVLSGLWGQRIYTAKNPERGAMIDYFVARDIGEEVSVVIADSLDHEVRKLSGPSTVGLHRVVWDLQAGEPHQRIPRPEYGSQPVFVAPGRYWVKLTYGKQREQKAALRVEIEPGAETPQD
jgi:photosystem II stability/assembly factor-like uncharacterized protein